VYILYCDQSGSDHEISNKNIVVAGISVFERQTYWLSQELDEIVRKIFPLNSSCIELNGCAMHIGRGVWRNIVRMKRMETIQRCLLLLKHLTPSAKIMISVVDKAEVRNESPSELAYEQLIHQFDHSLMDLHQAGNTQRGLMICSNSAAKLRLSQMVNSYRTVGHRRGIVRNLSEVPLLLHSSSSRILQLADLAAYAYQRSLEKNDQQFKYLIDDSVHFSFPITAQKMAS
jgi:hypothetical protein